MNTALIQDGYLNGVIPPILRQENIGLLEEKAIVMIGHFGLYCRMCTGVRERNDATAKHPIPKNGIILLKYIPFYSILQMRSDSRTGNNPSNISSSVPPSKYKILYFFLYVQCGV